MDLTAVAFTGYGRTLMPCGPLSSKGVILGTVGTLMYFSRGVPMPPPQLFVIMVIIMIWGLSRAIPAWRQTVMK